MDTKTSPAKAGATPTTREARSDYLRDTNFIVGLGWDKFDEKFFSVVNVRNATRLARPTLKTTVSELTALIKGTTEAATYGPVETLMNKICDSYQETEEIPVEDQVAFVDHHLHPPHLHPHPYTDKHAQQKPDLLAVKKVLGRLYLADVAEWKAAGSKGPKPAVTWEHIVSALEGKKEPRHNPVFQAATYSGSLPGNFCVAYSSSSFQLLWSDPSGVYSSPIMEWSDDRVCDILYYYVHYLHKPFLVDSTVTAKAPNREFDDRPARQWQKKSYASPVVWVVEAGGFAYEIDCLISIGDPWSRMNRVSKSKCYALVGEPPKPSSPVIVKESFPNSERCSKSSEGSILDAIHGKGYVLGVMIKIADSAVSNGSTPIENIDMNVRRNDEDIPRRVKYRIVSDGSIELSIFASPTAADVLMTVHDVLEVDKTLDKEHNVLHRDISAYNILYVPPGHASGWPSPQAALNDTQPLFIRALLAFKDYTDENREDFLATHNMPSCLLIDFDNAKRRGVSAGVPRTGTPTFIARAMCGMVAPFSIPPPAIPSLSGLALQSYKTLHGTKQYTDRGNFHAGATIDRSKAFSNDFAPRHDAESCFWIIVYVLILALPQNADPHNDNTEGLMQVFTALDAHRISATNDSREFIIKFRKEQWERTLHPGLHALIPFLIDLTLFQAPEYALAEPELDRYHLHEAMQRLILAEVWRMKEADDLIPLSPQQRKVKVASTAGHSATMLGAYAKRKHDLDVFQELRKAGKKLRTKLTEGTTQSAPAAAGTSAVAQGPPLRRSTRVPKPRRGG